MRSSLILSSHLSQDTLRQWRAAFKSSGMVKFPRGWMNPSTMTALSHEVNSAVDRHGMRMNINLNNATRDLDVVRGPELRDPNLTPVIMQFARDDSLLSFCRFICDNEDLQPGKHSPLSPAHINREIGRKSHHGWHLDDAGYKLVVVTKWESVGEFETGGKVGYIPHFVSDEDKLKTLQERHRSVSPQFQEAFQNGMQDFETILKKKVPRRFIEMIDVDEGEAYLMEGRTVCHQITPLTRDDSIRISCCFSFDDVHDESNYEASADSLYSGKVQQDVA